MDLWGLLNCSKSLVFTFLCATNHAKALTFEGTFDLQINFDGKARKGSGEVEMPTQKDFTKKEPLIDNLQALESSVLGDKHTEVSEDNKFSKDTISESVRLR